MSFILTGFTNGHTAVFDNPPHDTGPLIADTAPLYLIAFTAHGFYALVGIALFYPDGTSFNILEPEKASQKKSQDLFLIDLVFHRHMAYQGLKERYVYHIIKTGSQDKGSGCLCRVFGD